ncbi:MAG: helix-turn-helix domain containing protein [Solirubrobacterales bacterium]|nr:helix-turn-helix domain containing protein [Solirubrobacterales bacterium]
MARVSKPIEDRERLSPPQRRALILDAANRCFARDPDCSLRDIAEEAGVSRQLVQLYFPGGGVGPVADVLFTEFLAQAPWLLADLPEATSYTPDEIGARVEVIVGRGLDWAEATPGAWLFGPGRDLLGSGIGQRWEETQQAIAAMISSFPPFKLDDSPLTRTVIHSELRALEVLIHAWRTGQISREDCETAAILRFTSLFVTTLPALN